MHGSDTRGQAASRRSLIACRVEDERHWSEVLDVVTPAIAKVCAKTPRPIVDELDGNRAGIRMPTDDVIR
jgi:hypothetical protein